MMTFSLFEQAIRHPVSSYFHLTLLSFTSPFVLLYFIYIYLSLLNPVFISSSSFKSSSSPCGFVRNTTVTGVFWNGVQCRSKFADESSGKNAHEHTMIHFNSPYTAQRMIFGTVTGELRNTPTTLPHRTDTKVEVSVTFFIFKRNLR